MASSFGFVEIIAPLRRGTAAHRLLQLVEGVGDFQRDDQEGDGEGEEASLNPSIRVISPPRQRKPGLAPTPCATTFSRIIGPPIAIVPRSDRPSGKHPGAVWAYLNRRSLAFGYS